LSYIIEKQKLDVLCDVLYHQMLYGYYVLSPFAPEHEIEAFIQYGFARTRSGEPVIDEPLVIMAAWNWLEKNHHVSLFHHLQHGIGNHAPQKNVFEAYVAFYVRKVFEQSAKLDDVFAFRTDFARRKDGDLSWQSEEFELVTVSVSAGSNQREISVVTPSCGPSSNVGLLASTNEDVLEWISANKECYAFCFPTEFAGPNIFFFVRSKATQQLLLVAMQARNYQEVKAATLVQGVRTVTPSWFWKSKNIKHQSFNDAPSLSPGTASRFCDALNEIEPSIAIKNVPYPVLRVFASWPADADIERTLNVVDEMPPKKKQKTSEAEVDEESVKTHDPDLHPLAALHLENFNSIGESFAQSWYKGDVEQHQVLFATRNPDKVQRRMSERLKRVS